MGVSVSEQETVIQFGREDKGCVIWTSDSTMMTKLDKRCKSSPKFYRLVEEVKTQDGELAGKYYELSDKKMLSFRSNKRELTDEQKAAAAERFMKVRKEK